MAPSRADMNPNDPSTPSRWPSSPVTLASPWAGMARRLHFYAGLFIGPFLLVAAVTSFFYSLAATTEQWIHHDQIAATSPAQTVPLDRQVATARSVYPDPPLDSVVVNKPGATTWVLFDDPALLSSSYHRAVFVDPSTGHVTGTSVVYGSAMAFPEQAWLSEMHR